MTTDTRIILMLGAPGAGKGTQGRLLAEHLQGRHISVGDLVRACRARGERLPTDRRTRLIDTGTTVALINAAIAEGPAPDWIVVDGFPRQAAQVPALADLAYPVARVVWLEVEFAEAIARMKARGRDGEGIQEIGLRHFHHEQSRGELRAALCAAALVIEDVDASRGIETVHRSVAEVIHRTCGQTRLDIA